MKKIQTKFKNLLLLSGMAIMLLALFAIGASAANDPVLNDTNIVVDVGGTHTISCTLNGATAVFSSLNTTVATVSSSGTVTGVSYGKTSITVQFFKNGTCVSTQSCTVLVGVERYVFFKSDGKGLMCMPGASALSVENYVNGQNGLRWVFIGTGTANEYYIVPRYSSGFALTANTGGTVSLSTHVSGSQQQRWKWVVTSGGGYLQVSSTNSAIANKKLKRSGYSFTLTSGSDYSICGSPFVSSFVALTGVSASNQEYNILETQAHYCNVTKTPSNASFTGYEWFTYTSTNTSVVSVSSGGLMSFNGTGTAQVTAKHKITQRSVTFTVTLTDKYIFGLSIQTNDSYMYGCDMYGPTHHRGFKSWGDKLELPLLNCGQQELFYYYGTNSWSNDFKSKNKPGATHTYNNIDDVDLMIFTGHGYAKNRNENEGLFTYNSLHFGTTNDSAGHPEGIGTGAASNFTTQDALYFGYQARTKWLVTYTCNFLNTAQGDTNVYHLLDQGGRLIMGLGSKVYIIDDEGAAFGNYLKNGKSFSYAFSTAAYDYHDKGSIHLLNFDSAWLYRIAYIGEEHGGSLNDTLKSQLSYISDHTTKIEDYAINKYSFNDYELY